MFKNLKILVYMLINDDMSRMTKDKNVIYLNNLTKSNLIHIHSSYIQTIHFNLYLMHLCRFLLNTNNTYQFMI